MPRSSCWHLPAAALLLLYIGSVAHGQVLAGVNTTIPTAHIPSDPECSTTVSRPIAGGVCPALTDEEEVIRGFGTYYDANCESTGTPAGLWNGINCCRTCIWSTTAVAQFSSDDLGACPPCVQQYYEAAFTLANANLTQALVPLTTYLQPEKCPFGNYGWLYNPVNDRCYYKSSGERGISTGILDAIDRCLNRHAGSQILNIKNAQEEEFVRLNLLYAGFFGETYTGLQKLGTDDPAFDNTWYWLQFPNQTSLPLATVGTPLLETEYHNFYEPGRGFNYTEEGPLCMEILPHKPKFYNPFSCTVLKHYICDRPAVQPGEFAGPIPQLPCTGPPAPLAGAVGTVALINTGGPAFCGFTADDESSQVALGGAAALRYGNPTCNGCEGLPTFACLACSLRNGDFRYTLPGLTPGNRYTLRLTFSEDYWEESGRRLTNIDVNGVRRISSLDVFALAGARFTPAVRTISVTASSATMTVRVWPERDNGVLSALEVYDMGPAGDFSPEPAEPSPTPVPPTPTPPGPSTPSPAPAAPSPAPVVPCAAPELPAGALSAVARINLGGPAICGFAADPGATPAPGSVTATGAPENWYARTDACSSCAANPSTACLACTVRWGSVNINVPDVIPGNAYTLRFTFSEVWWEEAGRRVFNVIVGGSNVLLGVDPFGLAGAKFVGATVEVNVTATAGLLAVSLVATTDNGVIAALEVYDLGVAPATPPPSPGAASPLPAPAAPTPAPATPSPAAVSSPSPAPVVPCAAPELPAGALSAVARINLGGPAICGFAADPGATPAPGSVTATGAPENWYARTSACSSCAATPSTACLACTVRWGSVNINVPDIIPGNAYTLRFTFSEVWWEEAGRRVFNVIVGGSNALPGVDPFALAGAKFVGATVEVNVTATAGSLAVSLVATSDNAIIAALEVYDLGVAPVTPPPSPGAASPSPAPATPTPVPATPSPAPPAAPCSPPTPPAGTVSTVMLVNAGGPAICGYTADNAASPAATGGAPEDWVGRPDVVTQCPASCNTAPTLACIPCTVRFGGAFSYSVPTTPGHTYTLRFTFSEVWWTAAGSRVLDVRVNGATVLAGADPFAIAGARFTPGVQEVTVVAGAGAGMTVSFVTVIDNATLSALEVYDMTP